VAIIALTAGRDLRDYFIEWPTRGMTRFLYHADVRDVATYLNGSAGPADFGISGLLAGPWAKLALNVDLDDGHETTRAPRWFNPQRALLLEPDLSFNGYPEVDSPYADRYERVPDTGAIGGYELQRVVAAREPTDSADEPVCFVNGLCWFSAAYDAAAGWLELGWFVGQPLSLPEMPLISNPPPPGVYAGPRLAVFAQLQDRDGDFLSGDDGLWVDPQTLRPGDRFLQLHALPSPAVMDGVSAVFGLYDPMTGERILTLDGRDHLRVSIEE
jgi:hypothetical protein